MGSSGKAQGWFIPTPLPLYWEYLYTTNNKIYNESESRQEKKNLIANPTTSKIGLLPPSKRPQ